MNFKRRGSWDDALFVIVLIVPAALSTARYFESERQMTQIAQAQRKTTEVVLDARPPAGLDRAPALALRASRYQPVSGED
jgi:hypothetical protein